MDRFTLMIWIMNHRKQILFASHVIVIINTILVGIEVYFGEFEWFGMGFWTWVTGMTAMLLLHLQLGDE